MATAPTSPGIGRSAVGQRVRFGELWLIDPEGPAALILRPPAEVTTPGEFVVVGELDATGELTSPQLPGLAVRVGELLAR